MDTVLQCDRKTRCTVTFVGGPQSLEYDVKGIVEFETYGETKRTQYGFDADHA